MDRRRRKIAFLIPHCFRGDNATAIHGSFRPEARGLRTLILDRVIFQIHSLFGSRHVAQRPSTREKLPADNPFAVDFDLMVFTSGPYHLMADLMYRDHVTHIPVEAPPPLLGFECARWIADNRGKYDYFVYLEDDICLRDPLMFEKLDAFYRAFGAARPDILLQPQRYEETVVARHHGFAERFDRLYIDYDAEGQWGPTPPGEVLRLDFLGMDIEFEPARNPHSGLYAVNNGHVERMAAHPDFLSHEKLVLTPMDTAATAFVARALCIYKPTLRNPSFFDIYHGHQSILLMGV